MSKQMGKKGTVIPQSRFFENAQWFVLKINISYFTAFSNFNQCSHLVKIIETFTK